MYVFPERMAVQHENSSQQQVFNNVDKNALSPLDILNYRDFNQTPCFYYCVCLYGDFRRILPS